MKAIFIILVGLLLIGQVKVALSSVPATDVKMMIFASGLFLKQTAEFNTPADIVFYKAFVSGNLVELLACSADGSDGAKTFNTGCINGDFGSTTMYQMYKQINWKCASAGNIAWSKGFQHFGCSLCQNGKLYNELDSVTNCKKSMNSYHAGIPAEKRAQMVLLCSNATKLALIKTLLTTANTAGTALKNNEYWTKLYTDNVNGYLLTGWNETQAGNKLSCDNAFGPTSTTRTCTTQTYAATPVASRYDLSLVVADVTAGDALNVLCTATTSETTIAALLNCCQNNNESVGLLECAGYVQLTAWTVALGTTMNAGLDTPANCITNAPKYFGGMSPSDLANLVSNCDSTTKVAWMKATLILSTNITVVGGTLTQLVSNDFRVDRMLNDAMSDLQCKALFEKDTDCVSQTKLSTTSLTLETTAAAVRTKCADTTDKTTYAKYMLNCCQNGQATPGYFEACAALNTTTFDVAAANALFSSASVCKASVHKVPITRVQMVDLLAGCDSTSRLGTLAKCADKDTKKTTALWIVCLTSATTGVGGAGGAGGAAAGGGAAGSSGLCACSGAILKALGLGFAIMIMNLFN